MGGRRRGCANIQAWTFAGALHVVVGGGLHAVLAALDILWKVVGGVVGEVGALRFHGEGVPGVVLRTRQAQVDGEGALLEVAEVQGPPVARR